MEEGQKMGGDGFTPGTQRFAFGLFFCCCLLLAPKIMNVFSDPEPEPPRVACKSQIFLNPNLHLIFPSHWDLLGFNALFQVHRC